MDNTKYSPREPLSPDLGSNNINLASSNNDYGDKSKMQELWILQTYKALREQGFYEPHIRVRQESLVQRQNVANGLSAVVV